MALPENKVENLKDKVGGEVKKLLIDQYKDLRRHEVDKKQARDIIWDGANRGKRSAEVDVGGDKCEP